MLIGLLLFIHGFEPDAATSSVAYGVLEVVFGFYVANYYLKRLYNLGKGSSFRRTAFETVLTIFITARMLANFAFGVKAMSRILGYLGWRDVSAYETIVTLVALLIIGLQLTRGSFKLTRLSKKPAFSFILSFITLILAGTGVLMLPAMTRAGGISFLDAFFTATSASCVTGLIVLDTAQDFTIKGQLVILLMIQLGGIGIVSFATFFATFTSQGVGIRHQTLMQNMLSSPTLKDASVLIRRVIFATLSIELIGAIFIYGAWGHTQFAGLGQRIYFSIFHAVSAFCNAGFSLYSGGLFEAPVRFSFVLHLVIAFIIIAGSLGFNTLYDLLSPDMLRERLKKPWLDWTLNTKIAVSVSTVLILLGTIGFFFLEGRNTLLTYKPAEAIVTAFFQSVTTRTAGFNTVDFSALSDATLFMMIGLMFVGASPGSTGGGIKTTAFFLLAAAGIAIVRGKKSIDVGGRSIPQELIAKAFSIFSFAAAYNFISILILSVTESHQPFINIVFEQVSAFATVGLSTGLTPELSTAGRIVIIISMFTGRVGLLTLAFAISNRAISTAYTLPKGYVTVS